MSSHSEAAAGPGEKGQEACMHACICVCVYVYICIYIYIYIFIRKSYRKIFEGRGRYRYTSAGIRRDPVRLETFFEQLREFAKGGLNQG